MKTRQILHLLILVLLVPAVVKIGNFFTSTEDVPSLASSVSIAGISVGMSDGEMVTVVRKRYGLQANPAYPEYAFLLNDNPVCVLLNKGEVTWVASSGLLEVDGVPVNFQKAREFPTSIGKPLSAQDEGIPLCDESSSGWWFPETTILLSRRETGSDVISIGDADGWRQFRARSNELAWSELTTQVRNLYED